jgi:hypothetical protein
MLPDIDIPTSIFKISVDDVLRAQGADPDIIRTRRPAIVVITRQAITLGLQKARPMGWIKKLAVISTTHNQFKLDDSQVLTGELVMSQLAGSTAITFAIGTLGMALDHQISASMQEDPAFGFTLDTVGSMLADALAQKLEAHIRESVTGHNQTTSLALSPGLIGWSIDEGQPQIFKVLQPDPELVYLSQSAQMIPRKSISFVIGIGCLEGSGSPCDFCNLNQTCPNRK